MSTLTTFIQHHSHYTLHCALFSPDSSVDLSSYFTKSEATGTEMPQLPLYNCIFCITIFLCITIYSHLYPTLYSSKFGSFRNLEMVFEIEDSFILVFLKLWALIQSGRNAI